MVNDDVAAGALKKVDLFKVAAGGTSYRNGLTYKVTAPAETLYVKRGTLVDVTFTVTGISENNNKRVLTVNGASAVSNPIATEESVTTGMTAVATANNKITITPTGNTYYNATYSFKATVYSNMSFAFGWN